MDLQLHTLIEIDGIVDAKQPKHSQILKIGNENVQDLNKRWDNTLPIIYNAGKFKFEPSDYTDSSNYEVVDLLNKFVSWYISTGKERSFQMETFLAGVENNFKQLKTDLHYIKLANGIKEEHKILLKSFINQYKYFEPKGFLSEAEIAQIKDKLNVCCQKLQSEFLNESERYMDFEENNSAFDPEYVKSEPAAEIEKEELFDFGWMSSISKFFKTKEINLQ